MYFTYCFLLFLLAEGERFDLFLILFLDGTFHPFLSRSRYSAAFLKSCAFLCLPKNLWLQWVQSNPLISPVWWSWSTANLLANSSSCRWHIPHEWFCSSNSSLYSVSEIPNLYLILYQRVFSCFVFSSITSTSLISFFPYWKYS